MVGRAESELVKRSFIHLPNRELLLFRTVLLLPNDSNMGFAWRILLSMLLDVWLLLLLEINATLLKKRRQCFVLSVLPAPLSPMIMID